MKSKEFVEILELLFPTLEIVLHSSLYTNDSPLYCPCSVGITYYGSTHEQIFETIPKFFYPLNFNEHYAYKSSYVHDRITSFYRRVSGYAGLIIIKNKLIGQYEPLLIRLPNRQTSKVL